MSTDDPKEQGAPETKAPATDDEDDTEGHRFPFPQADPDFASRPVTKADDDDAEGHSLHP